MSRLIQIVPVRSISPEGVGDCSRRIAERMVSAYGVTNSFIACSPLPPERRCRDGWDSIELEHRRTEDLLATLEQIGNAPILLHLSGYGFQAKGVPLWLARAMERWLPGHSERRLMTLFHEIYAKGPIWSSPFWLGWAQKWSAARLYRASDAAIATTHVNIGILRQWVPEGPPLAWLPSFSAIGEPQSPGPAASARPPRLVVFGRSSISATVYGEFIETLAAFVQSQAIEEIVDIGVRFTAPPARVAGVPLRAMGEIAPELLIAELGRARFGMLHYEANRLAKSGVFAAFCASGAIPICISDDPGEADGLVPGKHYLKLDPAGIPAAAPQDALDALQANARSWYAPHSISATVDHIHRNLFADPPMNDA